MSLVAAEQIVPARISSWERVDALLERLGDRLNPILVKETRQALKSMQFVLTFAALLIVAVGWSFLGVAVAMNEHRNEAFGPLMLQGYQLVLAFPLMVVVPFGAFRSLSAEREDGTFELLNITTLQARQIVSGKLGSAVLQMMIYLSVLAPCLGFTYLLRGVSIVSVGLLLGLLVAICLGLSMLALLLATATRERHWNTLLSVMAVIGLGIAFVTYCNAMVESDGFRGLMTAPVDDARFWRVLACMFTIYLSYFWLVFAAASSRLTFLSENRSTKLRWILVLQQGLFLGWAAYYGSVEGFFMNPAVVAMLLQWAVVGLMINGESGFLADRVRRTLPQSTLGRAFLVWFNPGPRTGYIFVMLNVAVLVAYVLYALLMIEVTGNRGWNHYGYLWGTVGATCYLAIYLGIGRLVVAGLRLVSHINMLIAVLLQFIVLSAGTITPLFIDIFLLDQNHYSELQITNPFWTTAELFDGRFGGFSTTVPVPLLFLVPLALFVFLLNLLAASRDAGFERMAAPQRVSEEERRLHPLPPPGRKNPWE